MITGGINMKYTAKYFKDNMPEWKRKKDAFVVQKFYRPLSFYGSSFAANHGISANTVSYFSVIVAIIGCILFLFDSKGLCICGAVLFSVWSWLDCVDGNLARSVRKQPFGEFADSMSSYILVGLMWSAMGIAAYNFGGTLLKPGNAWIILLGALASSADSLMRLIYQKYKNTEKELSEKGVLEIENDLRKDHSKVGSFRVRIEETLGIGGILPLLILLATIFNGLDLVIFYCFVYYGGSAVAVIIILATKAIKKAKLKY